MPLVPTPKNCDPSVKKAIQILTQKLGLKSVPIHANLTLTDLTTSSLVGTNASKLLESVTIGDSLDYTRPTLDTIQDIRTSASPTFAGLTITNSCVLGSNSAVFQPATDSTTFFQVLDTDGGTPIVNIDTTNEQVTIGKTSATYPFLINSIDGSGQIKIHHDNAVAYIKWTDGALRIQTDEGTNTNTAFEVHGKGTGIGAFRVYDQDDAEYIAFGCASGAANMNAKGIAPVRLAFQQSADAHITFFENATEGEVEQFYIEGYRTGDAKRQLEIGVGIDAADTASFDGLSNYLFDGNIKANGFLELAQKAGTATDGDLWNDSTQEALQTFVSGIEQTLVGVIFTQTADKTIVNTTTETTFFGTGVGTLTLPANFWVVGKTIRIEIHGDFADTGNPTVEVQAYYGTTSLIDSGAIALSGLGGTEEWECEVVITCRSTGVSGTVETIIDWEYETTTGSSAIERLDVSGVLRTIDTTASGALDVTFQWGTAAAANTLVSEIAFVEVLN